MIDFTFNNKLIQDYFNGDNSYVPVSELIYLHEHPLIKASFLIELEIMINKTITRIEEHNVQGILVERLIDATMKIGAELPVINQQNAPNILEQFRIVYNVCKKLLN
jgi:hypothetical protein